MSNDPDLTIHIPSPEQESNWSQTLKNLVETMNMICPSNRVIKDKLEHLVMTELDFQIELQKDSIADYTKEKNREELKQNNITPIKKK